MDLTVTKRILKTLSSKVRHNTFLVCHVDLFIFHQNLTLAYAGRCSAARL